MKTGLKGIRYLGVFIEPNVMFRAHISGVCDRALSIAGVLSRILPNVGGGRFAARLLYYKVVESVVLYASPMWAPSVKLLTNLKSLRGFQRVMLGRLARAYRSVSLDALCVLTGVLPIQLLVEKRRSVYDRVKLIPAATENRTSLIRVIKGLERDISIGKWQDAWDSSTSGRFTYSLIHKIRDWIGWGPPLLEYHLTQIMSGHGCFVDYLARIGKKESTECLACGGADSVDHTLCVCPKWVNERDELPSTLGSPLGTQSLIALLKDGTTRPKVLGFVRHILKSKEALENALRARRRHK